MNRATDGPHALMVESGQTGKSRLSLRTLPRIVLTALALGVVTPLLAFPIVTISVLTKSGTPTRRMSQWWAWVVKKCMGLSFSLHGAEKVVPGTSYLVVSNHQGNADILALMLTVPVDYRWVIKKELLKIPFFGWALGRTGAISLDRSDPTKAIKALQGAKDKLEGGWSVLIYPEGTRSSDPHLQPFKKGAFMLAVQTGIPLLPVTCNGAFHVMPKTTIAFIPGHITITIADPIVTEGLTEQDVPALMERTRNAMLANLDPDYDPFQARRARLAGTTPPPAG